MLDFSDLRDVYIIFTLLYAFKCVFLTPKIKVYFKKKHPRAIVPSYFSLGSAGCDLSACLPDNCLRLKAHTTTTVPTGLIVAVPSGLEMQIRSRSGFSKRGIIVANSPGTIDSDYRGEIQILIWNRNDQDITITHGTRIAQAIFSPIKQVRFQHASQLTETKRGTQGFGSTGF